MAEAHFWKAAHNRRRCVTCVGWDTRAIGRARVPILRIFSTVMSASPTNIFDGQECASYEYFDGQECPSYTSVVGNVAACSLLPQMPLQIQGSFNVAVGSVHLHAPDFL